MGLCLNRKVLVGLGIVAAIVLIVAPGAFLAALPVLVVLACPLSMVVMMRGMGGNQRTREQTGHARPTADSSTGPAPQDQTAELTRLQAEVDQLRAKLRPRTDSV